jgi:hypothetical protein
MPSLGNNSCHKMVTTYPKHQNQKNMRIKVESKTSFGVRILTT